MRKTTLLFFTIIFFLCGSFCVAQEIKKDEGSEFIGEFFDIKIPRQNYDFVRNAGIVLTNRNASMPEDPKRQEEYIWDQLILSYEAFRRGINVDPKEVEQEIDKLLKDQKADFDRKTQAEAYKKWVNEKTGEPLELFENQIRHYIQIEKLRKQIMESIQPNATDSEAHQEFLNEYNSLSIELVQFDERKNADDFYNKVKRGRKVWDNEKTTNPNIFKLPGLVALQFLMDIWRLPRVDLYKMMQMRVGAIYPPTPIYKGYGVFRIVEKRTADESGYAKLKDAYYDKIRQKKKYAGFNEWFKDLKKEANVKIYLIGKEEK